MAPLDSGAAPPLSLRTLRRAATLILVYFAAVVGLTWPLAMHFGSQLPANFPGSEFDPLYATWVLSWVTHTLASGSLAIANANIYYPAADSLFYGPAALGALPFFAPTYLLTGNPTLAANLLLVGSIALTAAMLHMVVHFWTRSHAAGAVTATTYLANRWLIFTFIPTVPHLSVQFYFPLIILLSAAPAPSRRASIGLLVLVIAQCLTDVSYVTPAVLAPLIVIAALRLLRPPTRASGLRVLAIAVAAGAVVFAVHARYFAVAARNPHLAEQTNWRLDPMGSALGLRGLLSAMSPLAIPSLAYGLLAVVALLVAWRGWRGSATEARAARYTLIWIAVGIAVSLPPRLTLFGQVVTLPHLALAVRWSPFANVLRLPERLRVAALMGTALLVGLAFTELVRQLGPASRDARARVRAGALAALLVAAMFGQFATAFGQPQSYGPRLPLGYRLHAPPADSPVLAVLRTSGGPTLEVPLPRDKPVKPAAHAPAMYRSIFHWQPVLNGYSSYWPVGFPERMAFAARLPDPSALRKLRRDTGLVYVLARVNDGQPVDASLEAERKEWLDLAQRGGRPDLQLVASDDRLLLFRVTDEPAEAGTADESSPPNRLHP